MEGRLDDLPAVEPGGSISLSASFSQLEVKRVEADILRPTGHSVASAEWCAD
jgi:hypothetical protein